MPSNNPSSPIPAPAPTRTLEELLQESIQRIRDEPIQTWTNNNLRTFVPITPEPSLSQQHDLWLYNAPFNNSEPKMPQQRTLLSIVKGIKKNWASVSKNENATYWKWLYQKINRIYTRDADEFLEPISKYIGRKIIKTWDHYNQQGGYYTRDYCKLYWINNTIKVYCTPEIYEKLVNDQLLFWDQTNNCLVSSDLKISFKYKEGSRWYTIITSTANKFHESIYKCKGTCNTWYYRDYLTECPNLICEFCQQIPKINPRPTIDTIIEGYHSHGSSWHFQDVYYESEKNIKDSLPMGLEIELHPKKGNKEYISNEAAWAIYQAQLTINPEYNYFYFERDGSLFKGGFELITQPMSLEMHQHLWPKLLPEMVKHCVGWNTEHYTQSPKHNYGIHITFHRRFWSDYRLARLIKFFDERKNFWFVRGLAQRQGYYEREGLNPLSAGEKLKDRIKFNNRAKDKKLMSMDRYQPVNIKDQLAEVRLFRSTLNVQSFLKNLEFIDAFLAWCKESAFNIDANQFCQWLYYGHKLHHRYPNLIGYLSRKEFPIKNESSIKNPVYELFSNLNTKQLLLFELPLPTPSQEDILNSDLD